ncbi:alpha-amylase [Ochromonadaceae sp. CCMP2298]|nr:alpha-amylase [Ochromonadaceae sp. CCMP2298]
MPRSLLALTVLAALCSAAADQYSTGASVQLFEWSWKDVADECETYLSAKGFKAVQISPPQEHIQGSPWWTRYQPVSYNLTSRSGNEEEFIGMVKRCSNSGISIIADAVINHMADGSGVGTAGSPYGSRTFTLYSPSDFHHLAGDEAHNCQVDDYSDKNNVQNCDLVSLPDLDTASPYVQNTIAAYINRLASLGVRGIRIDAAKHQDDAQMSAITKQLPADFYVGQEVISGAGEAVTPNMYYATGQVSEFNYAAFLDPNIITEHKMAYLQTFGEAWGLMPEQYAVSFLDNHDTQRNGAALLTYKDGDLYTFANMFMLSWPYGNARVMSSYYFSNTDQGPPSVGVEGGLKCMDGQNWVCEHRWTPIGNMVAWRNAAGTAAVENWTTGNDNQIAFSRGAAFIAFNRDPNNAWVSSGLQTGLKAGTYCNVLNAHDADADTPKCASTVTVDGSGVMQSVTVEKLSAVGIHVNAML